MTEASAPRSIADALSDVARRQGEDEERQRGELAEVDAEIHSLKTAMAELEQQLEALTRFREELSAKLDSVSTGASRRTYDGIFATLREQAQALSGRAVAVAEASRASRVALATALEDARTKKLLEEYQQFKDHVEPHLGSFPDSYRVVLESKHDEVQAELRRAVGDLDGAPPQLDAPELPIDIVIALDSPEGVAEVVMMVLPVVEHVQMAWADREEDLQTWVAARAMQAIYQVCHAFGLPGAQAMYGGHQGLLAVEVELGAGEPAAVRAALEEALGAVCGAAAELSAAKVRVVAHPVHVDHLFPPEDEPLEAPTAAAEEVSHAG